VTRQLESLPSRARAPTDEPPTRAAIRILELQRAYGNRRVARWVLSRQPAPAALADTATGDNRALAKEIDEIRKLDTQALYKRHAEVEAALAAGPTGTELERLSRIRDAIDFVRAERIKGNWTPPYPGSDNSPAALRGAALREIQHHGSVDYGLDAFDKRFKNSDEADKQSRQLVAEKEAFAKQFTSQAKQNADKILGDSLQSIYALMRDYGLPRRTTSWPDGKFKEAADEWIALTKSVDDYRSEYYGEHAVTHRQRLGQWVKHLQKKQEAVHHADEGAKSDVDDPYGTKREQDRARNELAAAWMQAEKLHPILAAYRQDKDKALESVDLWELSKGDDDAMRSVLLRAMPTVANIKEARRWLGSGKLSPLTLAPVVELTRKNMFVPRGSFRDAVVQDIVADAGSGGLLTVITIALTLVLLLPTGGASGFIAGGLIALDLYSAGKQYIAYGRQQALRGTDLDRARSLSDEHPSLTGVVISLVSAGIGGAQLINVFRQVQAVRNLAAAGSDTDAAVKALNKVGEELGAGDLGTQAAKTGRRARAGAGDKPPATEPAPGGSGSGSKPPHDPPTKPPPDRPPTDPPGRRPGPRDEHTPPSGGRPSGVHPPVPVIEELVLGYGSRAEVVKDVAKAMGEIQGDMPRSWQLVKDALIANGGRNNRKILALVDKYMGALRDPKHWAEVIADVWEAAGKMPNPDFRKALLELAERRLGTPLKMPNRVFQGDEFFQQYVKGGRPLIDTYFQGKAHGDLSHLLQDLVLDKAFGAGKSAEFRQLLGRAEGKVHVWEQAAKSNTVKLTPFGQHSRSGANTTFLEGETEMSTGDYVWRWTYDLLYNKDAMRRLPQPEIVNPKLDSLFDFNPPAPPGP
jgi:hypothetical protein